MDSRSVIASHSQDGSDSLLVEPFLGNAKGLVGALRRIFHCGGWLEYVSC